VSELPESYKVEREGFVDALDHISRVCRASRTQTRRLRWIEARARCAVEGGQDWRDLDLPASADSQSKRILNLLAQRDELQQALAAAEGKYHELIMAVARKFPNETRHETALRYIRQAEQQATEPGVVKAALRGEAPGEE